MRDGACLRSAERACGTQRLAVLFPTRRRPKDPASSAPATLSKSTHLRHLHQIPPCPPLQPLPPQIQLPSNSNKTATNMLRRTSFGSRQRRAGHISRRTPSRTIRVKPSQPGQALRFAVDGTLVARTPARSWLASSGSNSRTKSDGVNQVGRESGFGVRGRPDPQDVARTSQVSSAKPSDSVCLRILAETLHPRALYDPLVIVQSQQRDGHPPHGRFTGETPSFQSKMIFLSIRAD
jgi:hypothetical protein